MRVTKRNPISTKKPILEEEVLRAVYKFASEPTEREAVGGDMDKGKKTAPRHSDKGSARIFFAPEGDVRLTINIKKDLHKRLKIAAIEKGKTAGDLVEESLEKTL